MKRIDEIFKTYARHETALSLGIETENNLEVCKQAILEDLLALPELQDETMPENLSDYTDDEQRKYWYNKCRQEWRKALIAYFEGEE